MALDTKKKIKLNREGYLAELEEECKRIFETLSPDKQKTTHDFFIELKAKLLEAPGLSFGKAQEAILKLKLARHFQRVDEEDLNVLFDALMETPGFIENDKGSLVRLKEIHEQKTLQRIAEYRKKQADETGQTGLNPYQKLVTSASGKYCIARLLNMSHLEQESSYMRHCVGTSTSYLNRMKRGEIEIWSFRGTHDDNPIITIEYNLKEKWIEQIKKANDGHLTNDDSYFQEFLECLVLVRNTRTDGGDFRDFADVFTGELEQVRIPDNHLLTNRGVVSLGNFDQNRDTFVFHTGSIEITPRLSLAEVCKIIKIKAQLDCRPEEVVTTHEQVKLGTKVYAGPMFPGVFNRNFEHIIASSGRQLKRFTVEVGGKTRKEIKDFMVKNSIAVAEHVWENFHESKEPTKVRLVRMNVSDLGFADFPVIEEIYNRAKSLGLQMPPPELAFDQFVNRNENLFGEWFQILRQELSSDRKERFYYLQRYGGFYLESYYSSPGIPWDLSTEFVFQVE